MKFFPELGLCFGTTGASDVTQTAVETTLTLPLQPRPELAPAGEEVRRLRCQSKRRRLMKVHSATWKPELSAIAEDRVVSDGRRKEELAASRSEKKGEEKKQIKRPSKYGDDYRKSCHRMVIPAFSPAPFVF